MYDSNVVNDVFRDQIKRMAQLFFRQACMKSQSREEELQKIREPISIVCQSALS